MIHESADGTRTILTSGPDNAPLKGTDSEERAAGARDARREITSDGWTLDTARRYLAALPATPDARPYGAAFDATVRAFVEAEEKK